MRAFILAGGFATRLWPLTERRAKPLLPIMGKPLISYAVEAVPADFPITVSTNAAFAEDFKKWKSSLTAAGVRGSTSLTTSQHRNVTIRIEDVGHEDQKIGALGAVALWVKEEKIGDDVLLLAGDNYVGTSMAEFLGAFRGIPLVAGHDIGSKDLARQFGTIVLSSSQPSPPGRGWSRTNFHERHTLQPEYSDTGLVNEKIGAGPGEGIKKVLSFEEKPEHPKSTIVSTGWWVLPTSSLSILVEFAAKHPDNVGGIFEEFLRRKLDVDCFTFTEIWKDIGSFSAYMSLHREVVGDRTVMAPTAKMDKESTLRGSIDIAASVTIERSTLTDCILFEKTTIKDCVLERCIIDEGCALEGIDFSDKMLRAGTVLRRQARQ